MKKRLCPAYGDGILAKHYRYAYDYFSAAFDDYAFSFCLR